MLTATGPSGKVARTSATRTRKSPSLRRVLRYRNNAVVVKLKVEHKLSQEDAEVLFRDTLKFMWLAAKFGRVGPPPMVDKGWHTFILFTMDYQKFCRKYFGQFIHHRPHRPEDAPDDGSLAQRAMALISEHLGTNLSANWRFSKGKTKCREYCKCPCK